MGRVTKIEERNKRVESDKAWETCYTRKFIISILTYLIIVAFLIIIRVNKPWLSALVPTIGYFLSTLTLPFFKKCWLNKVYKK